MYPNQQNPPYGGGRGAPYPQQPPYGGGPGMPGGMQPNMPGQYGGNQPGYGGSGNPYSQGGFPPGGPGGNFGPGGYPPGGPSGGFGQGGYPPGGQSGGYGQGSYPPGGQTGGYGQGAYPQGGQSGGYGQGAYPQGGQSGGYGQGAYPQGGQSGGYGQGGYPQGGGYGSGGQPPYGGNPYRPANDPVGPAGQGGGFNAGPGGFMPNDPRAQRLNQVIQQYEINPQFAARLQTLTNCEVVLLCDDSGSMNTPIQGTNQTRWDELKSLANIVIDICAVTDSNGVDVYFLNREPMLNVTDTRNARQMFNMPPQGLTPLVPALRRILASKRSLTYERKLLILIATDGAPTNEHGQNDIGSLEAVLRNERTPQTYVTFLACTDDLQAVNYLTNWDKSMPNLDVMDDYRSERGEIQRTRGPTFPFSFGDYIVKSLLGAIDPWFDSLDDRA